MPQEYDYAEMIERMDHSMVSRTINALEEELKTIPYGTIRYETQNTCLRWCYYVLECRYLVSRIDI